MRFILHLLILFMGLLTCYILIEKVNYIDNVFRLEHITDDDVFLLNGRLCLRF